MASGVICEIYELARETRPRFSEDSVDERSGTAGSQYRQQTIKPNEQTIGIKPPLAIDDNELHDLLQQRRLRLIIKIICGSRLFILVILFLNP